MLYKILFLSVALMKWDENDKQMHLDLKQIFLQRCDPDTLGINEKVDFILTFWMVHEVKDQTDFFSQLQANLNGSGKILIAEPKIHVSAADFQKILKIALSSGLRLCEQPPIRFSHSALFMAN